MSDKIKVAVLFGGLSSEHDVSILSGLQVLEALDPTKYEGFPVYVGLDGQWWVGDALRERKNYLPDLALKRRLTRVSFDVGAARTAGRWVLRATEKNLLGGRKEFAFDVCFPVLHGTWGEDGTLQGVLSAEGVPTVGGNVSAMGLTINKAWTLHAAMVRDIPVLPTLLVWRDDAVSFAETDTKNLTRELGTFPLFVKPNYLGSSLGARVVHNEAELHDAVAAVFRMDYAAVIQPCVANLVEYNVAVRRLPDGTLATSAIERPHRKGEMLDFKDKYMAGGGADKLGNKLSGQQLDGLVNMTRVFNPPELDKKREAAVRNWAERLFAGLDLAGAPRLDFMCNEKTGEIWFNEINPIPGSLAFFLWEKASQPVGFSALLDDLITEARGRMRSRARVVDPTAGGGGIFPKRG